MYDLLQLAAVAAMAMPESNTLELWNGGKGVGMCLPISGIHEFPTSYDSLERKLGSIAEPSCGSDVGSRGVQTSIL